MKRGGRAGDDSDEGIIRLRSAGGVVVRGQGDDLRVAVMRSGYGTWVFPKGRVEEGEEVEGAARRELAEEVGLNRLKRRGPVGWTEHEYEREGNRCRKRVDWFLFEAPGGAELRSNAREGSLDCGWFTPRQAMSLLSHASQRRLLRKALAQIGGAERAPGKGQVRE